MLQQHRGSAVVPLSYLPWSSNNFGWNTVRIHGSQRWGSVLRNGRGFAIVLNLVSVFPRHVGQCCDVLNSSSPAFRSILRIPIPPMGSWNMALVASQSPSMSTQSSPNLCANCATRSHLPVFGLSGQISKLSNTGCWVASCLETCFSYRNVITGATSVRLAKYWRKITGYTELLCILQSHPNLIWVGGHDTRVSFYLSELICATESGLVPLCSCTRSHANLITDHSLTDSALSMMWLIIKIFFHTQLVLAFGLSRMLWKYL